MIFSIKKDEIKDSKEMADLHSKARQIKMVEKLGKQGFHYDTKELFELLTKAVTDTSQELLEETKSTTKEIEELHESNFPVKVWVKE